MNAFLQNLIPSANQHQVGWEDSPFLARLTGCHRDTTTGLFFYSFIEQSVDPTSGIPIDTPGGRQTYPATGTPASSYALEVNNLYVPVVATDGSLTQPFATPVAGILPYPYVWLKLRSNVQGDPIYEFSGVNQPVVAKAGAIQSTGPYYDATLYSAFSPQLQPVWIQLIGTGSLVLNDYYPGIMISPYDDVLGNGTPRPVVLVVVNGPSYISSAGNSATTLTTTWSNIGSAPVNLPANTVWFVQMQLTATITASATGAGDSLQFRFYDGTNVYGAPVTVCNVLCDSVTFTDAGSLTAIAVVGSSAVALWPQGQIVSSSGSTGSIGYASLAAVQIT